MAIKKVQREEIKQSPREKLVIYKSLGDFKITPESNFKARIQNANKITDLKDFDTVDEIIDYYKKWFHSTEDDFIIDDSVKEVIQESLKLTTAFTNFDEKERALAEWIYTEYAPYYDRYDNVYYDIPTYDTVIDDFDDRISRKQYEKVRSAFINAIENANYYESYLELSDAPILNYIQSSRLSQEAWNNIRDKYLENFEDITGVEAWLEGRSGRHVVVHDTIENLFAFTQLQSTFKKLQDEMIEEVNQYDDKFDPTVGLRTNVLEIGDKVLYVFYDKKNNKLCAGGATNTGIIPEYEIDYDVDSSLDSNLDALYDKIISDGDFCGESLKQPKQLKKLVENTPNFYSMRKLPLLVFYEDVELDDDFDGDGVCVLSSDDIEDLEKDIEQFNDECENSEDYDPWEDAEVKVKLKPGYFEAVQLYCDDTELTDKQLSKVAKFFDEMQRKYGLTRLTKAYQFSNGEAGYSIVKSEPAEEKKQEGFEQDIAEEWGKKAYLLNEIISSLNDENAYYGEWIYIWPDGTEEEDAKYYFETETDYNDLFDTFERVYRRYHDDGLVTTDKNIISAAHEFDKKFGLKPIEIL